MIMSRLTLPIFSVLIAVLLVFLYIKPTYDGVLAVADEIAKYDVAILQMQEMEQKKQELLATFTSISSLDRGRLEKMIPNEVAPVHLLTEIDAIATAHNMSMEGITFSESENKQAALGVESTDEYHPLTLQFTVNASYDDFIFFLKDLESSLRLIDVREISLEVSEEGSYGYTVTLDTYRLSTEIQL